jgi:hypothetical protein
MKFRSLVILAAPVLGAAIFCAGSAQARHNAWVRKTPIHCVDPPTHFSLQKLLLGEKPQPNGCAPPVYQGAEYIGQDPDPNIRFQLLRDPDTGYTVRH